MKKLFCLLFLLFLFLPSCSKNDSISNTPASTPTTIFVDTTSYMNNTGQVVTPTTAYFDLTQFSSLEISFQVEFDLFSNTDTTKSYSVVLYGHPSGGSNYGLFAAKPLQKVEIHSFTVADYQLIGKDNYAFYIIAQTRLIPNGNHIYPSKIVVSNLKILGYKE